MNNLVTLIPFQQTKENKKGFLLSYNAVEVDTEKDIGNQLCEIIGCETLLCYDVTILGQQYILGCSKEAMQKEDGWLPTFPLVDESGEVVDLVANSYIIIKGFDGYNFTPMEQGEMEAIISQMNKFRIDATEAARKILLKHS